MFNTVYFLPQHFRYFYIIYLTKNFDHREYFLINTKIMSSKKQKSFTKKIIYSLELRLYLQLFEIYYVSSWSNFN